MMIEGVALYILEKFLGKAGEAIGEKALGELSRLGAANFRRFVNRRKLDFLSSNEDFSGVRAQLECIHRLFKDIFHKIDEMYHMAWPPDKVGVFSSNKLSLISAKLAEIQRQQLQIMDILNQLSRSYPSIPVLIGRFMTEFQDTIELLTISSPRGTLDRELIFVTYVPRVINTRAGLIYAAKESIDRNLGIFKKAVSHADVDAVTLVQMRKYERLSYVMGTAVGSTLDYMDSVKKGAEIPKIVEALSNLIRAHRLETERLRGLKAGPLSGNLPREQLWEAQQHIQQSFRMLSSTETGPMAERIAKANTEAKKAIKSLQRLE
jgi:hypothetical protein